MKIGFLVNTDKNLTALIGMTKAAVARGHEVSVFIMDEGSLLLRDKALWDLSTESSLNVTFCDYNAGKYGVDKSGIPETIASGSQFDNANMMHDVDKVICL